MRNINIWTSYCIALVCLLSIPLVSLAQQPHDHEGDTVDPLVDPTLMTMLIPMAGDFAPVPDDPALDDGTVPAPVGVASYFEVTDDQKVGVISPSYQFNDWLQAKVRVPYIFKRTYHYFGTDAEASGLGDITVDAVYSRAVGAAGALLRLQASAKLPTGDDEKVDDDGYATPLGSGTVDILAKGQYARSTAKTGLLASVFYRKNGSNESIVEWIDPLDSAHIQTSTTTITAASQFVASVFARRQVSKKLWVHLGASGSVLGDGKSEYSLVDTQGPNTSSENSLDQGGTLLDLFPGLSYSLGKISPYLGVRIPLATSWDNEFLPEERETAIILQFSYRPERLAPNS
ncbi:MAG: hypothetical protein ABIF77_08370 [bacterium]